MSLTIFFHDRSLNEFQLTRETIISLSQPRFFSVVISLQLNHGTGDNCTGFRMPAVGELDACAWPASESRQGTNPRSGVHGDGALAMGIWLTRDSRDGGRAQL